MYPDININLTYKLYTKSKDKAKCRGKLFPFFPPSIH